MKIRAMLVMYAAFAQFASAANSPPLSESWNIAPSGTASSSGELLFRVTPGDGGDATEITVSVLAGTKDTGVAGNIRRALNSQLRGDRFNVDAGEGANVSVTSAGKTGFSIELIDSDVENVRVAVQSVEPVVPPTVPKQALPANPPNTTTPTAPASGEALPPEPAPGGNSGPDSAPPPG